MALTAGLDFIINQRVAGANTPMYPITKTANVQNDDGTTLVQLLAGKAAASHGNHVPDFSKETMSSLKFLRNDNTWAEIQAASTTQKGVVQLSSATDSNSTTLAATASAVKAVMDAVNSLSTATGDLYVKKTLIGAKNGVASLDANGIIPASQLPSYVDDVIEGYYNAGKFYKEEAHTTAITGESGKIYVDLTTLKTYRWSGTAYVVISETLALGETASTAFRGDYGKVAYDHSKAAHARVDATKVEASEKNGYVKVTDKAGTASDVLVYTHPGTGTNPHGTTKTDVGLGKVENKTAAEIIDTLTAAVITKKLGYTPQNAATVATAAQSGVMSAAQAAKLDKCLQIEVVAKAGSVTITDGLVFQCV